MEPKAVDFFTYCASDMKKSIEFYRDILGLKLTDVSERDGDPVWVEFEVGGTTIALHAAEIGPQRGAIALAVDDVTVFADELKAKGVDISFQPMDTGVCWLAGTQDPDDNPIILHRRHDGTQG